MPLFTGELIIPVAIRAADMQEAMKVAQAGAHVVADDMGQLTSDSGAMWRQSYRAADRHTLRRSPPRIKVSKT